MTSRTNIISTRCNIAGFVYILFAVCIFHTEAETIADVDNLLKSVFDDKVYNKKIRGKNDLSEKTEVSVRFNLHKILKFDELHGTIQFRGNIHVQWIDERLVWKPKQYNGIKYVGI